MGLVRPLFFFLSTNVLVGLLCYLINSAYEFIPAEFRLAGTSILVGFAVTLTFFYAFVLSSGIEGANWKFYVFFTYLVMTTFDYFATIDLFVLSPKTLFVTHYLNSGDPFLENLFIDSATFIDGTLFHLVNLVVLCKIFNGSSWRSLFVFLTTAWTCMSLNWVLPMFTPQAIAEYRQKQNLSVFFGPIVLSFPLAALVALRLPKVKTLGHAEKKSGLLVSAPVRLINFLLTLATALIIGLKTLVVLEVLPLKDFLRVNDPFFFFQPLEKNNLPMGPLLLWTSSVVIIPSLLINLLSALSSKSSRPSFQWDLTIMQLGVLAISQGHLLLGPHLPHAPKGHKVDPTNVIFWALNLIPILTTLVNILCLTPYRNKVTAKKYN